MTAPQPSLIRLAFAGMFGMAVAMGIGRFVYTPILPGMMAELNLSPADAGWIASANYLGYLLGAFAAAGAWAAGHERRIMLVGLAVSALLAAAMGLTDSVAAFLIIRFLAGLTSAFVMIFLSSLVLGNLNAAGRGDLQGLHFAGVGAGIAISSLMMGGLVSAGAHWQAGWYWAGALSAAGLVAVAILENHGVAANANDRTEPPLPKDSALIKLILAYGMFGFGYIVTATFLIAIVRQAHGGQLFETAIWLVTGLAALPSVYVWAGLGRGKGPTMVFVVGCLVEAIGVAASVSLSGTIGPLLGGVLLGGTFVAVTAYGLRAGQILAPQSPRRVFALMTASFGIGQILGPIVAGLLAERTGDYVLSSLLASLVLIAAAAIAWSGARQPQMRIS